MINERDELISTLLFKCIAQTLTEEEQLQLDAWRQESEAHEKLYSRLVNVQQLEKEYQRRKIINTLRPLREMQGRIAKDGKRSHSINWRPWAVAASIAVIVGLGIAHFGFNRSGETAADETSWIAASSIKPGSTQAVLTLPGGERVELGADDKQNTQAINRLQPSAQAVSSIQQLSLEVPRGGEFKIILEDSTEVWLNSESKLIYPESFSENERRVSVVGEAYFHVAKDADRPFYVETYGQQVKVYGTEFNIRSYEEDEQVYTTLIEGSISLSKLNANSGELMLSPGHQAMFDKNEETTSVKPVNTKVVTCWKEGRFVFEDQNLEQIMRILSRWYNFDYQFDEESLRKIIFMGSLPRYSEFNTILALIEKSGGLKFSVQGSSVIISQDN